MSDCWLGEIPSHPRRQLDWGKIATAVVGGLFGLVSALAVMWKCYAILEPITGK